MAEKTAAKEDGPVKKIAGMLMAMMVGSWAVMSCGGSPGGTRVIDCSGVYTGSYEGSESGKVTATLNGDLTTNQLTMSFPFMGGPVRLSATVTSTGGFSGMLDAASVEGKLTLADCTGTGTWKNGSKSGTMSFAPVEP